MKLQFMTQRLTAAGADRKSSRSGITLRSLVLCVAVFACLTSCNTKNQRAQRFANWMQTARQNLKQYK